ncbi:hypothetical protein FB451DRAFT_1408802 [Mycena latifolia]|nr:hypothetical protein FB451DRAFT_1408802 [Mycena latifolia]
MQGVGGGVASSAADLAGANVGAHVVLGGIVFQFVAILIFSNLACDFVLRCVAALAFSTTALIVRSVYRTIELATGWDGRIIHTEVKFNVMDGGMDFLAIFTLNIAHPGLLLRPAPVTEKEVALESVDIAQAIAVSIGTAPSNTRPTSIDLRHLYCDFEDVRRFGPFETFSHPLFSYLTHLELFAGLTDDDDDLAAWSASSITGLSHLTHLSFDTIAILAICAHLLTGCRSLHALIILRPPPRYEVTELHTLAEDPRFVMMLLEHYTQDWQRGILTGNDYWSSADSLIEFRYPG